MMHTWILYIVFWFMISINIANTTYAHTWSRFDQQLQKHCLQHKIKDKLYIKDFTTFTHAVLLDPEYISHKILRWIAQGGQLLIAWEIQGLQKSSTLMEYLDLSPIPFQNNEFILHFLDEKYHVKPRFTDEVEGVWWHPQHNLSFKLAPWLAYQPIAFKEGPTWFTKNINPLAVTYDGLSFAYRVRLGEGVLTFLGDSDALSDSMVSVPQNYAMMMTVAQWFTKEKLNNHSLNATHLSPIDSSIQPSRTCRLLIAHHTSVQEYYIDPPLLLKKIRDYTKIFVNYMKQLSTNEQSLARLFKILKFLLLLSFIRLLYRKRKALLDAYKRISKGDISS
jgi:hypothetical protein